MAVYTQVSIDELNDFLDRYGLGLSRSFKGIAEGVENSNYLVETDSGRFILTLYEKRVNEQDLPFFISLVNHLSAKKLSVPLAVADKNGQIIQQLAGRPACLFTFLTGVSTTNPSPSQCLAAGRALGQMHHALQDFTPMRPNILGPKAWADLAKKCEDKADKIARGLGETIAEEVDFITKNWPVGLPKSVIHADLFPDNVLMQGDQVTGLIDFYFACYEIRAWDVAVTHSAWCFAGKNDEFCPQNSQKLLKGYCEEFDLSNEEQSNFLILCRGAALRFLLTRSYDWLNHPKDALVTRKDPLAYLRRLDFYRATNWKDLIL